MIATTELTTQPVGSLSRQVLSGAWTATRHLGPIWILEEVAGHLRAKTKNAELLRMRLYRLKGDLLTAEHELALDADTDRADAALSLLAHAGARGGVVVCSHRTAAASQLAERLEKGVFRELHYVLEIDPARRINFSRSRDGLRSIAAIERVETATWQSVTLSKSAGASECFAANLGKGSLGTIDDLTCFALCIGGIPDYRRGILVGMTSLDLDDGLKRLAQLLAWTRWIRLAVRKAVRSRPTAMQAPNRPSDEQRLSLDIVVRANRRVAAGHDEREAERHSLAPDRSAQLKGRLTAHKKTLNVVELFAGAGGMGLGFLSASAADGRGYRIAESAEIHPIYIRTLKHNHAYMEKAGLTPAGTTPSVHSVVDLCSRKQRERLGAMAKGHGDVDILIGGPPCQGFSSANRNSWSSSNPNNRLIDAFLDCVAQMGPKILLMENVQGILWTPRDESISPLSVAAHVLRRLSSMGYQAYPKLLDAVWYGVPQNRNRFFLLGIHSDLGYVPEDFGTWGPFPRPTHGPGTDRPFVTVRDAIADLPRVGNGDDRPERPYKTDPAGIRRNSFLQAMRAGAPSDVIWDHVTSRHADYVIERYKAISQGQNWQAARELMTNYADVERTHSNIYRRLAWDEPAITIGHYRKSMLIHPSQHRGLSLREAARLQGFPDWFRFAGTAADGTGGLMHKQQQLANAVAPRVTKAVADFVLDL